MTRIAVLGACGRMGQHVIDAVLVNARAELGPLIERPGHPQQGAELVAGHKVETDLADALTRCDALIDFSSPAGTLALLEAARAQPRALVIATTGLAADAKEAIASAARAMPVVFAPNFSRGIQVLCELIEHAVRRLPSYEIEVLELHHSAKVDAPSGTALRLAEVAAKARDRALDEVAVYTRQGHTGARAPDAIGLQTLRVGSSPGEHTVFIGGPGERIELTHRALSRDGFASGAVAAACWAAGRAPGLYGMADVRPT
jgi:4-hydroxy-tetrahydrodipicolinate reductase